MGCTCTKDWGKPEPSCSDYERCTEQSLSTIPVRAAFERIHALLGSALVQSIETDDKIIMENIKAADNIALNALRSLR